MSAPLETATRDGRKLGALMGLAESRGVDYLTVLRHAANDTLRVVVEKRELGRTLSPSRPGMGARDPVDCLAVLTYKREPEWR